MDAWNAKSWSTSQNFAPSTPPVPKIRMNNSFKNIMDLHTQTIIQYLQSDIAFFSVLSSFLTFSMLINSRPTKMFCQSGWRDGLYLFTKTEQWMRINVHCSIFSLVFLQVTRTFPKSLHGYPEQNAWIDKERRYLYKSCEVSCFVVVVLKNPISRTGVYSHPRVYSFGRNFFKSQHSFH